MKTLIVMLFMFALAGCATTYHIQADPSTGKIVTLDVSSRREFENGLSVKYNPDTMAFEFVAGKVTNGVSPLETAAATLLLTMPQMIAAMAKPVP